MHYFFNVIKARCYFKSKERGWGAEEKKEVRKEKLTPHLLVSDSHEGRGSAGARLDWHDVSIGLIQR